MTLHLKKRDPYRRIREKKKKKKEEEQKKNCRDGFQNRCIFFSVHHFHFHFRSFFSPVSLGRMLKIIRKLF
ncbi:hypothetical protein QVD17_02282 [Tagetes erecta]|uniref:Uncharacterized protein n=1 Tax=Tagetes erecta TaxID=13708 RepID=A0AAD8P8W3_TARER|nr:hypothetical protein QVD17_02282 [Tagetes erecta]